ncbi:MAG: hypothetical protein U1E39_04990 [Planctomycetota bacterium]
MGPHGVERTLRSSPPRAQRIGPGLASRNLVRLLGLLAAAVGLAACGGGNGPRAGAPAAGTTQGPSAWALRLVPTAALPRVGTLGDAPADAVEVVIADDGTPYLGGARVEAERFEAALRAAVGAPAAGTADVERNVIVRVAAEAPWVAVERVRAACRAVGAWRLHVAVVGEGDGAEGAMALFLPAQEHRVVVRGKPEDEPPPLPVALVPADVDAPDGAVFAALRDAIAAAPEAPVRVSASSPVAVRKVLRTVDLAVRAGAPRVLLAAGSTSSTDPVVTTIAVGLPTRWVDGSLVAGAFPAVPRVERAAPGTPAVGVTDAAQLARGGRRPRPATVRSDAKETDAVEMALQWLARHQSPDGRWEAAGFARWRDGEPVAAPTLDGAGDPRRDVGVTGAALLAILGSGYTSRSEGPLGETVKRAAAWLVGRQEADGCFAPRADAGAGADHVLATLAITELYGMTGSRTWEEPARRAVELLRRTQLPSGAWPANLEGGTSDDVLTCWAAIAMGSPLAIDEADRRASKPPAFGLDREVPVRALAYLEGVLARGGDAAGLTLSPWGGRGTAASSPDGLLAAVAWLRASLVGEATVHPSVRAAADRLAASPWRGTPDGSATDVARAYLATSALFAAGGAAWRTWERSMGTAAWRTQRLDGDALGSWDPHGPGSAEGGRAYVTAMHALCGELWYRYDKVFRAR